MSPHPRGRERRDLRLNEAAFQRRRRQSIVRIVLLTGVLIALLVFWSQLSQMPAGCFQQLAPPPPEGAPSAPGPDAAGAAPQSDEPAPGVRVKLPESTPQP